MADTSNLSVMDRIALLPDKERDEMLEKIHAEDLGSPELWLRPNQLEILHSEAWLTLFLAGRGAGKSHTGAHWVVEKAKTPGTRIALLGRTVADVRDVMVNGQSGIMAVSSDTFMPEYKPSVRRLVWPNGSSASTYSSESPSQLRGPQQHYAWADETAAFKAIPDASGLTAWDNLLISTRLGENPQILATTTPKRTPMLRELIKLAQEEPDRVKLITGSTLDNKANLSEAYIKQVYDMYAGTALERQELYGELIDAVEGALWQEDHINYGPLPENYRSECLPIIGVDPGVTSGGDATGIVVALTTLEHDLNVRKVWICEDLTTQGPPEMWAPIVANAYERWSTGSAFKPIVVAEGNQGYELIRTILMQENPSMQVVIIPAVGSKEARAHPVALAYVRGRVLHTKPLDELEQEYLDWEPDSRWSPNHLDAAVHAVRSAIIDPRPLRQFLPIVVGRLGRTATLPSAVPSYRSQTGLGLTGATWRQNNNRRGLNRGR